MTHDTMVKKSYTWDSPGHMFPPLVFAPLPLSHMYGLLVRTRASCTARGLTRLTDRVAFLMVTHCIVAMLVPLLHLVSGAARSTN